MTTVNAQKLRQQLERQVELSQAKLHKRHPHVTNWFTKRGLHPKHIRHHAAKLASAGALAGAMFLASPSATHFPLVSKDFGHVAKENLQNAFGANLKALLPSSIRPLTPDEENAIEKLVKLSWGIDVKAALTGEHLNTTYGYIGLEQHLPRYPGDSVENMTPGRGAWGYFAQSQSELTPDLIEKEKYYVAVQTLYLPDWESRLPYLREWYKHRKVVVMNPKNGKIIVAVIGDSGPAQFTGKSFGGSPEVMEYLESKDGAQKGPVVLFFLDDPENSIPLGPVKKGGNI